MHESRLKNLHEDNISVVDSLNSFVKLVSCE